MSDATEPETIDLLLVDDDDELRGDVARFLSGRGYRVHEAASGEEALAEAERRAFDVAILDYAMPGLTGLEVLERLKARAPECEIVMLTGEGTIEVAVEAMKLGAREFLAKPISLRELDRLVRKAYETGQLQRENLQLKAVIKHQQRATTMIGESPAMQEVYRLIQRTGPANKPILIQGDSGTGKELVARALHQASPLADKPFVVINCAALPETLLESELFGHEKGAFTGAVNAKPGLFEVADGGTLFIDEIGELAGSLQAKLLRVLEDGSLRRIGSVKERRVRVRLLAATNRDMDKEVREGRFREDLFYRINVLTIFLPPLREREGDIRRLVDYFAGPDWNVENEVLKVFEDYSWPGNVRQLQNAIERAKILAEDEWLRVHNLPPEIVKGAKTQPVQMFGNSIDLDTVNRMHVADTFKHFNGNKARTARALGIGRRTLYRLLEKYGIEQQVQR
ncbi:MAG: sigma-54-dependent Fis family transcriptional regulator [Planctomycetota bacterium]|nr:MAG: sigma-54-dependent Fis family transcriptional regulator [Planctomycetota bacterium]